MLRSEIISKLSNRIDRKLKKSDLEKILQTENLEYDTKVLADSKRSVQDIDRRGWTGKVKPSKFPYLGRQVY